SERSPVRGRSVQPGAAVLDPHVRPLADSVQVGLVDGGGAAVVHAHVERVAAAVGLDPVLDRVAGHGATGRARGDGDVAAALAVGVAAGEFLGRDRADDAAQDRTGDVGAAVGRAGLDRDHRAAVVAARTGG